MHQGFGTVSKIRQSIGFAAVGIILSACEVPTNPSIGSDTAETGQTVNANETVKVALLVPAGSGDGNLEKLANNFVQAARLATQDYSDVKIDLTVYSTGGNSGQAAGVAKTAVANGAKIIVGPLFAESVNAAGNAVASQNVNVLSFSNNTAIAGGNVFIMGDTFENKANRVVKFAASKGYRRIATVSAQNTVGEISASAVKSAAAKANVTYTGNYSYEMSPAGLSAAAPAIASSVKSSGTTAIVLTADSDTGLPFVGRMLPAAGVSPASVKYLGITRWDIPSSNLTAPGLVGGWFTTPDIVSAQQFNARFTQAYGGAPHPLAGLAYDGVSAVAKLLQTGSSKALTKSALTRRGGFRGTTGVFRFNKDGTNERALAIAEGNGKTFRIISGAPTSFSGAGS
ncbi:hypothetical protein BFP76_01435 [Amylibacter kogurei]|uniref:Receptor ligand binding region domain-containing protein n=1 Tax=Paramylibacter kogurei TaxID=1889778 RepID=A0A2G5K5F2_9RHOB|nr:penicillin-binding protein activator [Amylibacter kogurei]PIB23944.1 hypothetical protein BFP76_01435 [Amylibacter kogurei]